MAKLPSSITDTERDEFAEGAHDLIVFARRNWIYLALLLAAILVVFLIGKTMSEQRSRINGEVNERLAAAMDEFGRLQQTTIPAQRETAATQLAESLDLLVKDFPDHPLAAQAVFLKGRTLYSADRFEDARAAYSDFIARASGDEAIARGEIALGYANENESFVTTETAKQRDLLKAALSAYAKAAERVRGSYLEYYALMAQARVHEAMGAPDEAIRLYKRVAEERPYPSVGIDDAATTKTFDAATIAMNADGEIFRELIESAESQMTLKSSASLRLKALEANVRARPMPAMIPATAVAASAEGTTATATADAATTATTPRIEGLPTFPIQN